MAKDAVKEIEQAQQVNFLKKVSFFSDFDDHELAQFLTVSKWLKVPKGTLVIKEGTVERVFYILVRGEVSVIKTVNGNGKTIELTRLSTGDSFGEMALVSETKRTAGVMTTVDSYILRVEPEIINTSNVFLQLKFFKRFCEIMVSRLALANQRMVSQNQQLDNQDILETAPAEFQETEALEPEKTNISPAEPAKKKEKTDKKKPASLADLPAMPEKKERLSKSILRNQILPDQVLAVNPALAASIDSFLTHETTNTRALTDLLYLEPALCAKVLRVANSSLYRRSCTIATVPHAIVSVGINVIQEILQEAIQAGIGVKLFGGYEELSHQFWRHSVAVARTAELLKEIIRINNISVDVYMAGLLHDLGMLLLDSIEPAFYPQLLRQDNPFAHIDQAEIEYAGASHSLVGWWFAEKIGLPAPYQDVMKFHHSPQKARDNILLVCLVHLANVFVVKRGICVGPPELRTFDPMSSPAWVMIRREHHPFANVNVADFVPMFEIELDKLWDEISVSVPLP